MLILHFYPCQRQMSASHWWPAICATGSFLKTARYAGFGIHEETAFSHTVKRVCALKWRLQDSTGALFLLPLPLISLLLQARYAISHLLPYWKCKMNVYWFLYLLTYLKSESQSWKNLKLFGMYYVDDVNSSYLKLLGSE